MSCSSSSSNSNSNSPCAACKFLRRKCIPLGCIFAPYFPPENPTKFIHVHRVFGASNVSKLLNELSPAQREDAVNSLAYEAEARLRDPVLGCVGYIALLQHRLMQLQRDLSAARRELSLCIYAAQGSASTSAAPPLPLPMYRDQQQHHHQYQYQYQYQQQQQMMMVEMEQFAEVVAAERAAAAEASRPLIGGFEGSFVELQHQQGLHHDFQQRRFDEGRSGEGPSS